VAVGLLVARSWIVAGAVVSDCSFTFALVFCGVAVVSVIVAVLIVGVADVHDVVALEFAGVTLVVVVDAPLPASQTMSPLTPNLTTHTS
jgi:hypothetical protein